MSGRAVTWALVLMGVVTILASLAVGGTMAFGFLLCAVTGSSCGGSGLDLAVGGGGTAIGVALLLAAWRANRYRKGAPG
jgi:hypothetical protein